MHKGPTRAEIKDALENGHPMSEERLGRGTPHLRDHAMHRRTEADAKAPEFWAIEISTRSFTFEAFGLTKESCLDAMRRALYAHAGQRIPLKPGPNQDAWVESEMAEAEPRRRFMGEGYRDGVCLTGGK
jgi:hypothetical protein